MDTFYKYIIVTQFFSLAFRLISNKINMFSTTGAITGTLFSLQPNSVLAFDGKCSGLDGNFQLEFWALISLCYLLDFLVALKGRNLDSTF